MTTRRPKPAKKPMSIATLKSRAQRIIRDGGVWDVPHWNYHLSRDAFDKLWLLLTAVDR